MLRKDCSVVGRDEEMEGADMRRLFRDILSFLAAVCASFNLGAHWHEAVNSEILIVVTMICLAVSTILGEADK